MRTLSIVACLALVSALSACSSQDSKSSDDASWDTDWAGDDDDDSSGDWNGDDDDDDDAPINVGQGGAQDFGLFKQILEDGDIPGPTTIDDVGFFNEHRIEFGPADCGENICVHGKLGMMGNMINGSQCSVVMMGMNSPIDPAEVPRPPLNLAIAVDVSGSMNGDSIDFVKEGLELMLEELHPEDKLHIVTFSTTASVAIEDADQDDPQLWDVVDELDAGGSTNIYAGLDLAFATMAAHEDHERQNRVILLSDGEATSGIQDPDEIKEMSYAWNAQGYSLTTIGMGANFDVELMQDLAEQGSGSFYFLEDTQAVEEVFVEEVEAFLIPLGRDVTIELDVESDWALTEVYGTKLSLTAFNSSTIKIPTVQLAHRTSHSDQTNGRRGGGGAIIAEVLPLPQADAGSVGTLSFEYTDPDTDALVTDTVAIETPAGPSDMWFADESVEKGFVMLNIYVGFRMAAESAAMNEDAQALGVLQSLRDNVADWLVENDDDDIEDDLGYVDLFIANLEARSAVQPEEPEDPWPND